MPSKYIGFVSLLLIVMAIPLTLFLTQQRQDVRQRASTQESLQLPADVDNDGCVGILDFNTWFQAAKTGNITSGTQPDINADGSIDIIDFNIWFQNMRSGLQGQLCGNQPPISQPAPPISGMPRVTPTSVPPGALYNGVLICTDHDSTKWHPLVKRNADGSINCTYTHSHGDDPHQLDTIFGAVIQYTGQEISYPWETHSMLGPENVAKHRVYDWEVVKVATCKPNFSDYGLDAIRREAHDDGNSGAAVRFHSFFVQAQGCDPKDPNWHGKISMGGHLDTNHLEAPDGTHIPLPDDGPNVSLGGSRRLHASSTAPTGRNGDFTWYYNNCSTQKPNTLCVNTTGGVRKEDWGPINPANPYTPIRAGGDLNGSYIEPVHLLTFNLQGVMDGLDGKQDGFITYTGFTDRYGNIVQSCGPVSADCIPLAIDHMKVGTYQFRADTNGLSVKEYDVAGPTGKSLIDFPN